jgi:excinuclease ABC subunit C
MFLEGNYKKLISQLKQKMKCFAEERLYEEAANIRDQIKALSKISQARENEVFKDAILDLKDKLQLEKVPSKIDAFDVSNIFGSYPVGAAVRFKDGLPDKSNYRRFKIKSVRGIDDFAMMKEIVSRRYKKASKGNLPDLIVIDGGRGQLNAAVNALRTLKINIMVISIAKEKEEIYFVDSPKTLILPPYDKSLKLIQRLRDEVHRFAISYHRNLRNRVTTASLLKDIKGIGVKRYKELKKYYPSIDTLKKTGLKELKRVPLIDEKTAKEIIKFLKKIN